MVRRAVSAAGVLLALSSGCSSNVTQNGTALLVVVEADPEVRMRAAVVNVTVRRGRGGAIGAVLSTAQFRPTGDGWPFTFVVQAQDPSAGVEVYAEVVGGGDPAPLSVARALTTYTANRTLVVPLMFWGGCTPMRCGALATCQRPTMNGPAVAEDCASAVMPPDSLTTYTPGTAVGACGPMQYRYGATCRMFPMPQGDGGTVDVPTVDVPRVDVPLADVSTDASTDTGTDAGTDAGPATGMDVPGDRSAADTGTDVLADTGTDVPPDTGGDELAQRCTSTGGTVDTSLCCLSAGDFPNRCAIGACSCPPALGHMVRVCNCPSGMCFNPATGCGSI
jgi:hypothetical protein